MILCPIAMEVSCLRANLPQPAAPKHQRPRSAKTPWLIGGLLLVNLLSGVHAEAPSAWAGPEQGGVDSNAESSPPAATKPDEIDTIVDGMIEIIEVSRTTPMGLGGPTPGNIRYAHNVTRPAYINGKIQATLLSHKERFAAICARLADIMSQYNDKTDRAGRFLPNELLQIALLMDTHSREKCLPRIISILPHTENGDWWIEEARYFCHESQWHSRACTRFSRTPPK